MSKIYLDMDGVLTDFDTRVIELLGKPLWEFGDSKAGWDALGDHLDDFFLHLEPMEDARDLVSFVEKVAKVHHYSVGILTALPKMKVVPKAEQHKKEWLAKYFPQLLVDFNIGPYAVNKQEFCQEGYILIDDSVKNIPQWNAKGGIGILHKNANSTIRKLKNHVEKKLWTKLK